ncbi:conserved hypothetical protein [Yersinia pestis biovar Antiqua str. B42003004]|nr:conserved hypothetical protein [Yersinia pestis Pestoides F]EDR38612.1 conserved hypothetical protein [Yersinia pestis biovar Orientalis str. F1991016]EDR49391.1 conserved hypothetical protein [Yersinia pestis biovar Antiqua str. B42003004]EDR59247.1 conserved hypothetical protein [Yersinia pestis biovar Orientalis str. MG05-1020]EDR59515.1 conserved hypothetical protein [Yersinia pestis biovar Antiqua str. UG05-0454]EDR64635.1 conserved hypothetical protein [Yersinia pestis biovar Mediaeva
MPSFDRHGEIALLQSSIVKAAVMTKPSIFDIKNHFGSDFF